MTAEQVYDFVAEWSAVNDKEFNALLTRDPAFSKAYLAIGRGGKKPRKDLALGRMPRATWTSCSTSCSSRITPCRSAFPLRTPRRFSSDFAGMFDENDTPDGFFDKMKQIASARLRCRYQGL